MKIGAVDNKQTFSGAIYTAKGMSLVELDKLEKNSKKLINYAKGKDFDYVLLKNKNPNGLAVLVKNIKKATREVFEVLGYPSGSENRDIDLILKTMQEGTDKLSDSRVTQGWSCE